MFKYKESWGNVNNLSIIFYWKKYIYHINFQWFYSSWKKMILLYQLFTSMPTPIYFNMSTKWLNSKMMNFHIHYCRKSSFFLFHCQLIKICQNVRKLLYVQKHPHRFQISSRKLLQSNAYHLGFTAFSQSSWEVH